MTDAEMVWMIIHKPYLHLGGFWPCLNDLANRLDAIGGNVPEKEKPMEVDTNVNSTWQPSTKSKYQELKEKIAALPKEERRKLIEESYGMWADPRPAPCPACGGEMHIYREMMGFYVMCFGCDDEYKWYGSNPRLTKQELINQWNAFVEAVKGR